MSGKERSPNYPAYTLETALQWARKLWEQEHKNPAPIEMIAKATGSTAEKGISGPARQKVAALRQYGLIESSGSGKFKISGLGLTLALHKPGEKEYQDAIRVAALSPPLFAELFAQAKSSDDSIRIGLIKEKDFSDDGARRAIAAFRSTVSFAKLSEESYTTGEDASATQFPGPYTFAEAFGTDYRTDFSTRGAGSVNYSWPLEDAEKVEVTFIGNPGKKPSRRDLEAVIDYLELVKKRTPEVEPIRGRELESD